MSGPATPPALLRTVTEFASQQAEFLRAFFDQDDQEFANLSVIKLQEEVGEVAEAFLALCKVQRRAKLKGSRVELREELGREIGDVTIVVALLADAVGLRFDEILQDRIAEIVARREKLLAESSSDDGKRSYRKSVPSPTKVDDVQLDLFASTQ